MIAIRPSKKSIIAMITSSSPAHPIQPVQRSFVAIRRSFRAFALAPVSLMRTAFLQAMDLSGAGSRTWRDGPRARRRSYSRRMAGSGRDEQAWVRRGQAGAGSDVEALFRAHWAPAYRAAYLVVRDAAAAEDIAQEGFLAAVRALDRFDRRRPFGPWLPRIVVTRAIDWARARSLRPEAEAVDVPALERSAPDEELLAELGRLSPEHRAVIVLRYLLEYTPGEIAELLELPRGTVNSRLRRGLDTLKERL